MAEAAPRDRSRSPARAAEGAGAGGGVPAHWGKPATAPAPGPGASTPAASSTGEPAPAAGKSGGKGGKAGGKRAALLTGTVSEETVRELGNDAAEEKDELTGAALLALAAKVEAGKDAEGAPEPAEVAKVLRQAAAQVSKMEKAVGEMGQALQAIGALAGRSLAAAGCLGGDAVEGFGSEDMGGRSYMIKKGDADMQEAHRAAQEQRPTASSPGTVGGSGSLSAAPKTKEEMDAARRARLERLEAAQQGKAKQQEDADAKRRAREAMFERPFSGNAKPLGRL